jgi:hypothetical protein
LYTALIIANAQQCQLLLLLTVIGEHITLSCVFFTTLRIRIQLQEQTTRYIELLQQREQDAQQSKDAEMAADTKIHELSQRLQAVQTQSAQQVKTINQLSKRIANSDLTDHTVVAAYKQQLTEQSLLIKEKEILLTEMTGVCGGYRLDIATLQTANVRLQQRLIAAKHMNEKCQQSGLPSKAIAYLAAKSLKQQEHQQPQQSQQQHTTDTTRVRIIDTADGPKAASSNEYQHFADIGANTIQRRPNTTGGLRSTRAQHYGSSTALQQQQQQVYDQALNDNMNSSRTDDVMAHIRQCTRDAYQQLAAQHSQRISSGNGSGYLRSTSHSNIAPRLAAPQRAHTARPRTPMKVQTPSSSSTAGMIRHLISTGSTSVAVNTGVSSIVTNVPAVLCSSFE